MSDRSELQEAVKKLFQVSPKLLSLNFNSVLMTGIVLFVFWPKRALFGYIAAQEAPILFAGVFIAALLFISYTNLIHGAGELIEDPKYPFLLGRRVIPFEINSHFFPKGLLQFALDSFFSCIILLPLLLIACAVSRVSGGTCVKALTMLYVTAFFFHLAGLLSFLLFGPQHMAGFFFSRFLFTLCLFLTGFFAPSINPIVQILRLHQEKYLTFWLPVDSYTGYMLSMLVIIGFLTMITHGLVERIPHKKRTKWDEKPVL